jgi:O-acetyl-ADP-ribose deacetylase (regulator of RNase III)
MISTIKVGNLLEEIEYEKLDGIMNAANGYGPMGAGIAGAIRKAGGNEIEADAFLVCQLNNPSAGDAYITVAGQLESRGIKAIVHAVTMKRAGGTTSYDIVQKAFEAALESAIKYGIKRIGCTALGTGVGQLSHNKVADIMFEIANKKKKIEVIFVDFNSFFIERLKELQGRIVE